MKTLTEKFFPAQLVALFVAVLCLLLFSTAQAAPNRNWSPQPTSQPQATAGTCSARYEVVVTHVNNRPMNKVIPFSEFQSHGRGRMPIRAAMRAKQNAERCMQTQWHGRQSGMIPQECTDQQRITGYHVQDFQNTWNGRSVSHSNPCPVTEERLISAIPSLL